MLLDSPAERQLAGIPNNLVRLSAGIEAVEDILADLEQALARLSHKKMAALPPFFAMGMENR